MCLNIDGGVTPPGIEMDHHEEVHLMHTCHQAGLGGLPGGPSGYAQVGVWPLCPLKPWVSDASHQASLVCQIGYLVMYGV